VSERWSEQQRVMRDSSGGGARRRAGGAYRRNTAGLSHAAGLARVLNRDAEDRRRNHGGAGALGRDLDIGPEALAQARDARLVCQGRE
jgi:hypothetical protein